MNPILNISGMQQPAKVNFAATSAPKKALPAQPADEVHFGNRQQDPALITVNGSGLVEKDPDTMRIQISLTEQGANRDEVNQALNAKSVTLVQSLKALKHPVEMQSNFAGVQPVYDYPVNGKRQLVGYSGSFSLNITEKGQASNFSSHAADIKTAAESIENANFHGVNYSISNRDDAEREALEKAVEDAKNKAQTVAKKMGFELEDAPHSIEIGSGNGGYSGGYRMASMADSGSSAKSSPESFQIGKIQVSSEGIKVQFKIKQGQ